MTNRYLQGRHFAGRSVIDTATIARSGTRPRGHRLEAVENAVRDSISTFLRAPRSRAHKAFVKYRAICTVLDLRRQEVEHGERLLDSFVQSERGAANVLLGTGVRVMFMHAGFQFATTLDRVNGVDSDTIEVVVYQLSGELPTIHQLHDDIYLSMCHLAAAKHYPWAKRIRIKVAALHLGMAVYSGRSEQTLNRALGLVEERTRSLPEYRPHIASVKLAPRSIPERHRAPRERTNTGGFFWGGAVECDSVVYHQNVFAVGNPLVAAVDN